MVLPRSPKLRIRGKASPRVIHWVTKDKDETFHLRQAQRLLPRLYAATKGSNFDAQAFRAWLATQVTSDLPTVEQASSLLTKLSQNRRHENKWRPAPAAWMPTGIRFEDQEGEAHIQNVCGFDEKALGPSRIMGWNEYGFVYRLTLQDAARGLYSVVRSKAFKRANGLVSKRTYNLDKKTSFKSCVVMDLPPGRCISEPKWSLIYLHSFSQKGTEYMDFPHYFNVCGASMRVIVPTAPLLEQECFKDWYVWRGGHDPGWRRIKFNAWFNYMTDKGGVAENTICQESLLAIRDRLHKLIRHEVQRVGDPRRVIVGGQSQGCCAALDATLTFEQELGGFVGLVGHLLRSTPLPLDDSKHNMPLHLFHEENDKEMRWKWVQGTVQRLIDAGFNVSSKRERDPAGCGHWIQDIEGRWVRSALRQIIFERDTQ